MPRQYDGNNGTQQAIVGAAALAQYYGAVNPGKREDIVQLPEETEDYSSPLVLMVTAPLDQSLGSSVWSSKIRTVLGQALPEYLTETAFGWNSTLHAPHETLAAKHEQRFHALAEEWRGSQGVTSSLTQLVMHPAYQQIIGMGKVAVPLIFRALEKNPDHWFWALKSITGVDPVSEANRGNIRLMAKDWLEWGARKGYQR